MTTTARKPRQRGTPPRPPEPARATIRSRARDKFQDIFHGRFTCSCCPDKVFRGHRALNAHHLARHGGYWGGKAGRAMRNKMGKEADAARRHARGWLEAHGHVDRMGRRTSRARSRPEAPERGHLRLVGLREQHRHARDHDEAAGYEARAERTPDPSRRLELHHQAANLRNRWPERAPRTR
jgi:hypothetical protein